MEVNFLPFQTDLNHIEAEMKQALTPNQAHNQGLMSSILQCFKTTHGWREARPDQGRREHVDSMDANVRMAGRPHAMCSLLFCIPSPFHHHRMLPPDQRQKPSSLCSEEPFWSALPIARLAWFAPLPTTIAFGSRTYPRSKETRLETRSPWHQSLTT